MRTNTAPDVVYTPAAAPHWSVVQMRRSSHVLPSVMERYYTTEDTLDIMELDPKLIEKYTSLQRSTVPHGRMLIQLLYRLTLDFFS